MHQFSHRSTKGGHIAFTSRQHTLENGDGLEEAARGLGVSINTTKTQLAQIYDKTNTRNRAKLVKLLMTLTIVE